MQVQAPQFLFEKVGQELKNDEAEQVSGGIWVSTDSGSYFRCSADGSRCGSGSVTDRQFI